MIKKINLRVVAVMGSALTLAACAETPLGPRVQVLPPAGKTYEQFAAEKQDCQKIAANDVHGQATHENKRAIIGGLLGTALGAGLGGAIGGGVGAGIGAGGGAVAGGAGAASYSQGKQGGIQTQYDQTYTACMVSRGNKITPDAVVVQPSSDKSVYAQ